MKKSEKQIKNNEEMTIIKFSKPADQYTFPHMSIVASVSFLSHSKSELHFKIVLRL